MRKTGRSFDSVLYEEPGSEIGVLYQSRQEPCEDAMWGSMLDRLNGGWGRNHGQGSVYVVAWYDDTKARAQLWERTMCRVA